MGLSFFLSFAKLKGLVSAVSAISLSSLGIHYGIVSPVNNSRRSVWIEGSSPELQRTRGNPYDPTASHHYFVGDFGAARVAPRMEKVLKVSDLVVDEDTKKSTAVSKAGFTPEITRALEQTTINAIKIPNWHVWKPNSYILINSEFLLDYTTNFLTSYSFLSEIEFPYKSYFYMRLINGMTRNDFIYDLIWSLAEESEYKKMLVRPESIRVSFDLEEVDPMIKKPIDAYPKDARKMNNFNFSFRIYNPNSKPETILRKIPIEPHTESEVNIRVQNSEIRPFSVPVRGIRWKAANWDLLPLRGNNFTINVNNLYPRRESRFMLEDKLNLIHGRSQFFDYLISTNKNRGDLEAARALNSPTFRDFKKIAAPMLASITSDQIKKDIETWYGAMFSQWMKIQIHDIEKLIGMIMSKIFVNQKGEAVSFMERFINNNTFRENFYSLLTFKKDLKNVMNGFFDAKIGDHQIKLKEILAFMTNTMESIKNFQGKFKITFEWLEEPRLEHSLEYDDDFYPAVSLMFKQTLEFTENFAIKFKGKATVDNEEVEYDLSQKLKPLAEILSPIRGKIGEKIMIAGGMGIGIFEALIPDTTNYIGWDKFELKKGQSISTIVKAVKSPIRPAVESNSNFHDHINGNAVFGWKLLDANVSYDLSNFFEFFPQFYAKIEAQKEEAKLNILSAATNHIGYIKNNLLNENPLTSIIKHINLIFPPLKNEESVWNTFFKSLLARHITFNSTQLFVGYSRAYFDIKDDFIDAFKDTEENKMVFKGDKTISNPQYDITKDTYNFPAKPKTLALKKIIDSFHIFYSTFFPNAPIVFKSPGGGEEYEEFLSKDGATSVGLIANVDKLKNILKKHYQVGSHEYTHNNVSRGEARSFDRESFPIDGAVDWNRVKISFHQFDLLKTLNDLMAKNVGGTVTEALGWASTLGVANINLTTVLLQLIQRDLFLVNVNLMMEDGSLEIYNFPNKYSKRNSHSVHTFHISPRFDKNKIKIK